MNGSEGFSRRGVLMGSAALGAAAAGGGSASPAHGQAAANPMAPVPMPAQVPAKEGMAQIPDTQLWYWDTGGDEPPVVLLHPATGSALIWGYQQPVLAKAGYRVIAYSRRGYYKSAPYAKDKPGTGSGDLHHLIEFLGLRKFHAVASAAGGSIAADYGFSHPERLFSLTVSSNSFGVRAGDIFKAAAAIRPKGWDAMPAEFRELGPSYRAANPDGVKSWVALEHKARAGEGYRQTLANMISQAKLKEMKVPVRLITGAADLITPPSIMRMIAAEIPGSEVVIASEAGHSVYWEQPDVFNRAVLDFIGKHS